MSDRRTFLKGLFVGVAGVFGLKSQVVESSSKNYPLQLGPWDTVALFNEKHERIGGQCVAKNSKVVVTWADARSTEVIGSD